MAKKFLKYNDNLLSIDGKLIQIEVESTTKTPEEKTVTPTTTQQIVTPTDSDHELTSVTVNAIETEEKTVTTNGDVIPSTGKFLSKVTVNVNNQPTLQEKTATPTTSQQEITADSGYDGLSKVTVDTIPSQYIEPTGTKTITTNGTHDVTNYASAVVNVETTNCNISYEESTGTLTITYTNSEMPEPGGGTGGGIIET